VNGARIRDHHVCVRAVFIRGRVIEEGTIEQIIERQCATAAIKATFEPSATQAVRDAIRRLDPGAVVEQSRHDGSAVLRATPSACDVKEIAVAVSQASAGSLTGLQLVGRSIEAAYVSLVEQVEDEH